jgi:Tfp pilus assembly protein PilF
MNRSLLSQLHAYYEADPHDPFNIYALALEYLKSDAMKAREFFELLLEHHEDYVPAYYHAALLFQSLGERENAIQIYEKGIQISKKHQDLKAMRELQSAYQELLFE